MLISLRWLDEMLGGDAQLDPDHVALTLTSLGLEVEGVSRFEGLPKVVVGEIRSVEQHPKADRLNVVQLFDGTADVQVVCGASNLPPAGGKVVFAQVGAVLPGDFAIGARELRGVSSSGMICSEKELEIGPDGDGIMVLPSDWKPGTRLDEIVPEIIDTVIEIGVTPNRPDALGHVGVARDLAVKLGLELRHPVGIDVDAVAQVPVREDLVTIETTARARCGRYLGYALENVQVAPSPLGVRVRLHRVGLRPINNVVDVTNLVLMEYGQPQHAFDMAQLEGRRVVVRMATAEEPMTTLDGTEIALRADDLVIADAKAPQALAGVMGGEHSMVAQGTSEALLEVAWFLPTSVRGTARHHGFHTDSSHRFERQVDYGDGLDRAARRALHLLGELAGARCVARQEATGELPARPQIMLRPDRIAGLLGISIDDAFSAKVLAGLGVTLEGPVDGAWKCTPPTNRPDLGREVDLIEEVMRHHGLEALPATPSMPTGYGEDTERAQVYATGDRLVDAMVERGHHEHIGFAFTGPEAIEALGDAIDGAHVVRVANPMRSQHSLMRMHLLPGLLDAAALNLSRHGREVRLFEFGRIYDWAETYEGDAKTVEVDGRLPRQRLRLAALRVPAGHHRVDDGAARVAAEARALAADLRHAIARLGHTSRLRPCDASSLHAEFHPGVQVRIEVRVGEDTWQPCGVVGQVHPGVADHWDLPEDRNGSVYGELWLEAIPDEQIVQNEELPRFPATSRDVSLEFDLRVPVSTVLDALEGAARQISATMKDESDPVTLAPGDERRSAIAVLEDYRGKGVDAGHRAVLFRLSYRASDRSVTDDEVQAIHDRVIEKATTDLAAQTVQVKRR